MLCLAPLADPLTPPPPCTWLPLRTRLPPCWLDHAVLALARRSPAALSAAGCAAGSSGCVVSGLSQYSGHLEPPGSSGRQSGGTAAENQEPIALNWRPPSPPNGPSMSPTTRTRCRADPAETSARLPENLEGCAGRQRVAHARILTTFSHPHRTRAPGQWSFFSRRDWRFARRVHLGSGRAPPLPASNSFPLRGADDPIARGSTVRPGHSRARRNSSAGERSLLVAR